MRVNNNIFCLPLQTPQSGEYLLSHESLLIIGEVCRKGEGGFLIVYLMWFLSACLITALPGSSPSFFFFFFPAVAAFTQTEPREKRTPSTAKGSHFSCLQMIFIYNSSTSFFFSPADLQIKDLSL